MRPIVGRSRHAGKRDDRRSPRLDGPNGLRSPPLRPAIFPCLRHPWIARSSLGTVGTGISSSQGPVGARLESRGRWGVDA